MKEIGKLSCYKVNYVQIQLISIYFSGDARKLKKIADEKDHEKDLHTLMIEQQQKEQDERQGKETEEKKKKKKRRRTGSKYYDNIH